MLEFACAANALWVPGEFCDMITQRYLERDGDRVLFRFAVNDDTVFDVLTTDVKLEQCRGFLRGDLNSDVGHVQMGEFGPFDVILNRAADPMKVQIWICIPLNSSVFSGDQCVGAYLQRGDLLKALNEAGPWPTERRSGEGR